MDNGLVQVDIETTTKKVKVNLDEKTEQIEINSIKLTNTKEVLNVHAHMLTNSKAGYLIDLSFPADKI